MNGPWELTKTAGTPNSDLYPLGAAASFNVELRPSFQRPRTQAPGGGCDYYFASAEPSFTTFLNLTQSCIGQPRVHAVHSGGLRPLSSPICLCCGMPTRMGGTQTLSEILPLLCLANHTHL